MFQRDARSLAGAQPVEAAVLKRYALFLQPSFSAFDLMAILECLKDANKLEDVKRYEWVLLSEDGQPVVASNGIPIPVDADMIVLDRRDTLIVLAGEEFVSTSTLPVQGWLRRNARLGVTIGAVSSAAYTLLQAGILKDHEIATHWSYESALRERFKDVTVSKSVFSAGQNRFTCAGGVATTDLMLQLISQEQGHEVATWVADSIVCSNPRTSASDQLISNAARLPERNAKVSQAVEIMRANLEATISPSQIASQVGVSTRQLERLFQKFLRSTPKAYYMKLRLQVARSLLLQTELSVIEVALATGFTTPSHFSKNYRRHFNTAPHKERGFEGISQGENRQ